MVTERETKRHCELKCDASHVCLFAMRKRPSIRNDFLHLRGKKRTAQRAGFTCPLLVSAGKAIISNLFGSRKKEKEEKEEGEDITKK